MEEKEVDEPLEKVPKEQNESAEKYKEIIEKYKIDLEKLKLEQEKLSKNLVISDSIDFSLVDRIAGIETAFFKNQIISAMIIVSGEEVVEQEYFADKIRFPYLAGFRAYRELSSMVQAFNKLDQKPDVVFIRGRGILHPRGLGLASHFSLSVGVPTIGVADSLLVGEVEKDGVFLNDKLIGRIMETKEGAKPLYVSPGNNISLSSSVDLVRRFTLEPHKFPEPLRLAKKYAKEIRKEIFKT